MNSRLRKLTLTAVTCIALVTGSAAQSDACCFWNWFGHGCCYQPTCCYQPSCCSSCNSCGYAPSCGCGDSCGCSPCSGGCGTGGCSSCGSGGCSSCGSGGCASGNCGVGSLQGSMWGPSFAGSVYMAPVVTVNRAPKPAADAKFAKPAVERRVATPSRDVRVVPVRQKAGTIQKIDLEHSANAKLRSRSTLTESRMAREVNAPKVSRHNRTSVVISVSAESVVR